LNPGAVSGACTRPSFSHPGAGAETAVIAAPAIAKGQGSAW